MILHGDSLDVLKTLDGCSIDALVTDPPYGLNNITEEKTRACLSAWVNGEKFDAGGAGFIGNDWDKWTPPPELWREVYRVMKAGAHGIVFASPRTQDLMSISLRLAGFEVRDTLQWLYGSGFPKSHNVSKAIDKEKGVQGEAARWGGWGTALKPAYEPVILVRKPLDGTIANNVLEHGTGALNIDATRVGGESTLCVHHAPSHFGRAVSAVSYTTGSEKGRHPANVILDEESARVLDDQAGNVVSRFFYCSKASKREREAGLDGREKRANTHPTVKPLDLMRYLVRLITPPEGVVLDPFAGSGSTLCAGALEGFRVLGIEREVEYVEIARARLAHWSAESAKGKTDQLAFDFKG